MKYILAAAFLFVLPAAAQRYRAPGGVVFTNPSGFGNAVFPGTGSAPVAGGGLSRPGSVVFPGTGGGPNSNFGARTGVGVGATRNTFITPMNRRSRGTVAVPVYVGGYTTGFYGDPSYGYGMEGPQQQPVNVTVVNPAQQAPTVIINQNFGPQQGQEEQGPQAGMHISQPSTPGPVPMGTQESDVQSAPHYFLVAFKDHSVYSALAYWIEDKTLHYVTPQNTHNQASLDLVDMDFTKKLNNQN